VTLLLLRSRDAPDIRLYRVLAGCLATFHYPVLVVSSQETENETG